jgi:protein BCP1
MPKRKADGNETLQTDLLRKEGEDESDDDMDMLNVDFEWFDPQPAVDFHGLKTLCRQLFDLDSELFNLSELVDLILSQPLLGSTVKVDGNESDPYAFLTVLNLHEHQVSRSSTILTLPMLTTLMQYRPVIKDLVQYLQKKTSPTPKSTDISALLSSPDVQVGLILTERLINMPSEIVPPMYTMLLEEIDWALEEKEPYKFTHYLVLSKVYSEVESKVDQEDNRPSKKKKASSDEVFYFHPEDEVLHKYAIGHWTYDYSKQGDEGSSDAKRAFNDMGVSSKGHLILIDAQNFKNSVAAVAEFLKPHS